MTRPHGPAEILRRRPEREADTAFRLALHTADHGAPFLGLDPPLRDLMLRHMCDGTRLLHRLRFPEARCEIVEADGAAVARIVTDPVAHALTLIDLAVAPERRGRGLGSRPIAETMEEARIAGLPLHLTVGVDNPVARRLCERLGFVPVGGSELHTAFVWTPPAAP